MKIFFCLFFFFSGCAAFLNKKLSSRLTGCYSALSVFLSDQKIVVGAFPLMHNEEEVAIDFAVIPALHIDLLHIKKKQGLFLLSSGSDAFFYPIDFVLQPKVSYSFRLPWETYLGGMRFLKATIQVRSPEKLPINSSNQWTLKITPLQSSDLDSTLLPVITANQEDANHLFLMAILQAFSDVNKKYVKKKNKQALNKKPLTACELIHNPSLSKAVQDFYKKMIF
jgi:hypothetical protein